MQIWTDNSRVDNYLIIDNYREISENVKLNINDATLPQFFSTSILIILLLINLDTQNYDKDTWE